jgi:RecA-family ATPase
MDAKALRAKIFPPIKYVVRGYVVEGATILAGRPKIGKSWLALDWGLAVARSGFVFGDIHCKEGEVLYIALEDNERRLKQRIANLLGIDGEWPEKFEYANEWPRADDGELDAIKTWIKSKETPRLIVIDVLEAFRSRARGKDNVYAADYAAIKALQLIASELHVAILIVHHLRKAASDGDAQEIMTSSQGLRPAKLLRVASLARSSPLISAAFIFDRNDSKGTIAAIATSGSFFSSRLS